MLYDDITATATTQGVVSCPNDGWSSQTGPVDTTRRESNCSHVWPAHIRVRLNDADRHYVFEMQVLLTETSAVEDILGIFLSGMILLVSINSIVVSEDMTSIVNQERRIRGVGDFWQDVDELSGATERPTDLRSFLELLTTVIQKHAEEIADATTDAESEFDEFASGYSESVTGGVEHLEEVNEIQGGDFALLWTALGVDYGPLLDKSHALRSRSTESERSSLNGSVDNLVEAFHTDRWK